MTTNDAQTFASRWDAAADNRTPRPKSCAGASLNGGMMQVRRAGRRGHSLGAMFDHVGIAVSDLAASERFYRTVLSVLGVEPSHADAELVEWEDWPSVRRTASTL